MAPPILISLTLASVAWFAFKRLFRRNGGQGSTRAKRVRRPEPLVSETYDDITIVSFNLLADFLATQKTYPHVYPSVLQWSHRWPVLQRELASFQSDFLCFQEVDVTRWPELVSSPALTGYTGLLQDRGSAGGNAIANAIMYRTDRFALVWAEHRSRALLAAFTFWDAIGQQQLLYVANVHLEGSPYRPNDRVSQMRSALQRLQAHQLQHGIAPADALVLVVGDFNSGRSETVCRFLERGRLEGGTTEAHLPRVEVTKMSIAHPYLLRDVYASGGVELPYTRKVPALSCTLDYIFASYQMEVRSLYHPIEARHEGLVSRQALPNAEYVSDHLPVGAGLRLRHFAEPPPQVYDLTASAGQVGDAGAGAGAGAGGMRVVESDASLQGMDVHVPAPVPAGAEQAQAQGANGVVSGGAERGRRRGPQR